MFGNLEVWLTVASPFIGSFLALLAYRLPRGEGFVLGRSRCPACTSEIAPRDLLPIVSWLMLKGRCRTCRASIAPDYALIEAGALAIAVTSFLLLDGALFFLACGLGWTLLVLAAIDARHMILPDALTLPLIPAGLTAAALTPGFVFVDHVIGAAAGAGALWLTGFLYERWRGRVGLGLGDVKLFCAGGAWIGWQGLPLTLFLAALAALAGVLVARWLGLAISAKTAVPFGTPLAAAIFLAWLAMVA